jgi:hypothetical protein
VVLDEEQVGLVQVVQQIVVVLPVQLSFLLRVSMLSPNFPYYLILQGEGQGWY